MHKDNDECLACCAPGCHQDLVWNVKLGESTWIVSDALAGTFNRAQGRMSNGPGEHKPAMSISGVQAVFTQAKAAFDAQNKGAGAQTMERGE